MIDVKGKGPMPCYLLMGPRAELPLPVAAARLPGGAPTDA